jgi:CHAD domain-containing protein
MGARRTRAPANRRPDVNRALDRQLGRALSELRARSPIRDAAVHEARKELKRARATLRLLREAIGDTAYRRANRRLRDAARPLSRVRDTRVLLDVISRMHDEETRIARRAKLASLAEELRRERGKLRRELLSGPDALSRTRESIQSVQRESRSWPAPANDSLRRGVERIYRRGRKAFGRADSDSGSRDDLLHESRKQTKYLGKAIEVLGPVRGSDGAKRAKRAASIADTLGDDHDLAVLRERLRSRSRSDPTRRSLLSRIERRRRKLQKKASRQSRRLYAAKAKAFAGEVDLGRRARG